MSVGLHILYGVMGAGKTNYAVNKLLAETTYKHVICNVPLDQHFMDSFPGVEFEIVDKYSPQDVISKISPENPSTLFIVDESQLVLTSLHSSACKSFAKKMSQIRQDDQDVILIAQTAKMLPAIIKEVATDCYKFENQNTKGVDKLSKVCKYIGGNDYTTKLIETSIFRQVYGNYETSNIETTEKPKNLYKGQYIKLGLCIAFVVAVVIVLFFLLGGLKDKYMGSSVVDSKDPALTSLSTFNDIQQNNVLDSIGCVRSFVQNGNIFYTINDKGIKNALSVYDFVRAPRCPL